MDEPRLAPSVMLSRGVHIVLSNAFLPGRTALLVPSTDDGRILSSAIPWHGHVLIGTTDIPVEQPSQEPIPSAAEVDYLIDHAGGLSHATDQARGHPSPPGPGCGVSRHPVPSRIRRRCRATTSVSVSRRGLVTVTGGKWTTCRKVAQDAVGMAADVGRLSSAQSVTARLRLHGALRLPTPRDIRDPRHPAPDVRYRRGSHPPTGG